MRKSVLTVTDLTERSDAAVVWADTIARARGWDLHVGHAIALAERERDTSTGHFLQLERAIVMADAASRSQMARTLSERAALPARVIDLDGLVPAMVRRAAHLEPGLIVISSGWAWDAVDADSEALSPAVVQQIDASLLIVRDDLPRTTRRIVVALSPDLLDAAIIRDAARWSHWLRETMWTGGMAGVPDLDVVFVEDEDGARDVTAAFEREPAGLIVVPVSLAVQPHGGRQRDAMMSYLLARASAPVLLLRESQRSPWSLDLGDMHDDGRLPPAVSLIA